MRNAIGGAWFYGIVIVFMSIFIAFIAIIINYHSVYTYKTQMIDIIEKNDGFNSNAMNDIATLLSGYTASGTCQSKEDMYIFGVDLNTGKAEHGRSIGVSPAGKYNYCIYISKESKGSRYIGAEVFLKFDLPVLRDVATFRVYGTTNKIYKPVLYDKDFCKQ